MNYKIVKNDLFDYENRYIFQLENGFKFSLDSILLAEYVDINKNNKKILDLCTGNAAIPLILSKYTDSEIIAFEIQKIIADLAVKSIKFNNLENQIKIVNDDINNIKKYYNNEFFDIIVCNPPFFKSNNKKDLNKNDVLSIARHEININLKDIFSIVKYALKENGIFYLVHRCERLDEIIILANEQKLKVKEIQLITTKKSNAPEIVLLKIKKQGNYGIKMQDIINVNGLKTYKKIFRRR